MVNDCNELCMRPTLSCIDEEVSIGRFGFPVANERHRSSLSSIRRHVNFKNEDSNKIGELNPVCDDRSCEQGCSTSSGIENPAFVPDHYYTDGPSGKPHSPNGLKCNGCAGAMSGRRKSLMRIRRYFGDGYGGLSEGSVSSSEWSLPPSSIDSFRSIEEGRNPSVFQRVAKLDNKLGVRHVLLILMLCLYTVIGGLIFYELEHEHELNRLRENEVALSRFFENVTLRMFTVAGVIPSSLQHQEAMAIMKDCYREMLIIENRYAGSVFHKYENFDERLTWYFSSALFFAMTLYTTIGYGTIACQTLAGKVVTIIYSVIGIPLMLMVLSDMGRVLLSEMTTLYNATRRFVRRLLKNKLKLHERWYENDGYFVDKEVPLLLLMVIVVAYLLICSWIISDYDYYDGMPQSLCFFDSFYYSFQSLATIGLGDVVPNNIKYNPLVTFMFIVGLALLSIINSSVYRRVERGFVFGMDRFDIWLQNLHSRRALPEGYTVFRNLSPNIQLLAMALPIFDDEDEANMHGMLNPQNVVPSTCSSSERRARHRSSTAPSFQFDQTATLGIFAAHSIRPRSTTFANYHSVGLNLPNLPPTRRIWTTRSSAQNCRNRDRLRRVVSESDEEQLIEPRISPMTRFRAVTERWS